MLIYVSKTLFENEKKYKYPRRINPIKHQGPSVYQIIFQGYIGLWSCFGYRFAFSLKHEMNIFLKRMNIKSHEQYKLYWNDFVSSSYEIQKKIIPTKYDIIFYIVGSSQMQGPFMYLCSPDDLSASLSFEPTLRWHAYIDKTGDVFKVKDFNIKFYGAKKLI